MIKRNIRFQSKVLISLLCSIFITSISKAQSPLYSTDFTSTTDIANWNNVNTTLFGNNAIVGHYMIAEGSAAATALRSATFTVNNYVCVEFDMMLPNSKSDGTTVNTIGGGNTGGIALMNGTTVAGVVGFRGNGSATADNALSTGGTSTDYMNVTAGAKATATRELWLHYTFLINTSTKKGDFYITNPVDGTVYSYAGRFDKYIAAITSLKNIGIVSNSGYSIGIANLKITDPIASQLTLTAKNNVLIQYIPSSGYVSTVQYTAAPKCNISYNKGGRIINTSTLIDLTTAKINYSVADSNGVILSNSSLIRIDSLGVLTIKPGCTSGKYSIKAQSGNATATMTLSVRLPDKADKLEITGNEMPLIADTTSTAAYNGIATVSGNILIDKNISWSLDGNSLGCSINATTGVLTIPSSCSGGNIIIRGTILSDTVTASFKVQLRTKSMVSNSNYIIKGAILTNGVMTLTNATGVAEVIVQKLDSTVSTTNKLVIKAYRDDNRIIAQKTMNLNNTVVQGIQSVALDSVLLFTNASYIKSYITDQNDVIITQNINQITSGSYKQIPLVTDWITNAIVGTGTGVLNPTTVPTGIMPSIVNTKNLNVTYQYDSNYPQITADNLLWYKTGAYVSTSTIYDQAGSDWQQQALPIGNGYLGGMLFGMPGKDHIQFNEESFWAAGYRGVQSKVGSTYINPNMGEGINGFMNTGNLFVDFGLPTNPTIQNYYRDLNLDDAVAHVQYKYNSVTYNREYFASYPSKVMVFHYTADTKGALNFSVNPISAHPGKITVNKGEIRIVGKLKASEPYSSGGNAVYNQESDLEYCTIVKVIADDGKVVDDYAKVNVSNASSVTIIVTSATDFDPNQFLVGTNGTVNVAAKQFKSLQGAQYAIDKASARMTNVNGKTYSQLKSEHIADYHSLYNRVNFTLTNPSEICQTPTNELQASYKTAIPQINPGDKVNFTASTYNVLNKHLEELHYNYARYLMLASSRDATLPATLQGKWNQSVAQIWGSCYCININLEMNYWFAGGANLNECGKSIISWLNSQIPSGRVTAYNMYSIQPQKYTLSGNTIVFSATTDKETDDVFIIHTKQSINGQTDKTGSESIQSPGNMAFMMYNIWDLYKTSGDKQQLSSELYPIMRKAANFYTQYMYANKKTTTNTTLYPKGYYYTTGSGRSPEQGPTEVGIKYDLQLVAGIFDYSIEAAQLLQIDADKVATWKEIRNNMEAPVELGTNGQIKEWSQETTYNTDASGAALGDPYHRHMSHLVGLYPGNLISRETPVFLNGAKVVLDKRGDESTGWSIANKFLMWARVLDGDKALQLFRYQLAQRTYQNMFDFHSPFQIDGNFGSAAGVMELLMQSQTGIIYILPALPKVWDSGSISGIKSKTGAEIAIDWTYNKATQICITPSVDGDVKMGYSFAKTIYVSNGQTTQTITSTDSIFTIPQAKAGVKLVINFVLTSVKNPLETNFVIYPNPTNGIVNVSYNYSRDNNNYRLNICDLKGVSLKDYKLNKEKMSIDLSKFASIGVYFLSLYENNNFISTKKVVLNNY